MEKITLTKSSVPVRIWTEEIESQAIDQLLRVADLPIIHGHVAAMPDVHAGIGATVGSVIPTRQAIIPAAVGVDIGCGMTAVRTSLGAADLPDSLRAVRLAIEKVLPVGMARHQGGAVRQDAARDLGPGLAAILEKHPGIADLGRSKHAWAEQIGSLGGGNHFVEVCLDESDRVWVMLHSGSRGIGNQIGRYFIERAKEACLRAGIRLVDQDLSYLVEGDGLFADYWQALTWAQGYAARNRNEMLDLVVAAMSRTLPEFALKDGVISCHHNYAALEYHDGAEVYITRKGAIRAGAGELGIIPGSMGARSYIVRGKGSADSFCSCSHGAGRRMSRGQAKRAFSVADLEAQTAGVECRKDAGVIDEIPGAYKDIDAVMANQADLVEPVHELKQVLCVKG